MTKLGLGGGGGGRDNAAIVAYDAWAALTMQHADFAGWGVPGGY